jgi:CRP-like cAMP-binding protein
MSVQRFSAGEVLFLEGGKSDRAYLIRSGRVEIVKEAATGSVRLAVLGAGELVGEMGLLEERPRSASARAVSDVTTEVIYPQELVRRLVDNPTASIDLLRALFERLRSTNQIVSEQLIRQAETSSLPAVRMFPASAAVAAVLPVEGVDIESFPYRVGRAPTDPATEILSFNELEVEDRKPFHVSPTHFALDLTGSDVVVRDRGSRLGTVVNGVGIGAAGKTDVAVLQNGDNEIIAGSLRTLRKDTEPRFRFKVVVA